MSADELPAQPDADIDPMEAADRLVAAAGAHARPIREVIGLLTEGPQKLASLIRRSAVSRRGVEGVLAAVDGDLVRNAGSVRLRPDRAAAYRDRFGYEQLQKVRLTDPLAEGLANHRSLVADLDQLISTAPKARQALDHVSATAETVVRRALWMDATFDLAGAQLLCVGDHDLTSLAVAQLNPEVSITVIDLDERILEFIDSQACQRKLSIRCLFTDLRFGIPGAVQEWADLLITDPPYTPEGIQLFLARGLAGLRDRDLGRLVMAYGFGERQPTLGLKVQRAVQDLHLVYEAILPHFNRYVGAQAVGSASDLYVCRPTSRTWKTLDDASRGFGPNIYTHGTQSLEGAQASLQKPVADALCGTATGEAELPLAVVADSWQPASKNIGHVLLATLLASGLPPGISRRSSFAVAIDLTADPGAWLLRALLAVNAERVALLVPNNHPDLASEQAQQELAALLANKYTLTFRRSTPDSRYAFVEAELIPAPADPVGQLTRRVMERAHGKIGNIWREGLVRAAHDRPEGPLTKNQARAHIHDTARRANLLDAALIDLPRHQIRDLLEDMATSLTRMPLT